MTNSVNWNNPYESCEGKWYRGNLHAHTSPASGCSQIPMAQLLDIYAEKGIDFLCVSDHMLLSEPNDSRLILIPGTEWNSIASEHTGVYSADRELVRAALAIKNHDELLDFMKDKDALVILNHPNWSFRPHYRREELEKKQHFDGIEIFNGVIERLDGAAIATDKWDYLLVKEKRVLGFASDDHPLRHRHRPRLELRSHSRPNASGHSQRPPLGQFLLFDGRDHQRYPHGRR